MKITAKDIERWAESRNAHGELPWLTRRLAMQAGSIAEIAFPTGESVSRPGWDGQHLSKDGDAWVPAGRSFWESPASEIGHDVPRRRLLLATQSRSAKPLRVS